MVYCFDIDGTICYTENGDYHNSSPWYNIINRINELYSDGNKIILMTARGANSGKDWSDFTAYQMNEWGVKYHELIMNKKPHADVFIDDKAINIRDWVNLQGI